MKATLDLRSVVSLIVGLVAAPMLARIWASPSDVASLGAGYILFALNYLALKGISRTLILIAVHGTPGRKTRLWLSLGSLFKFTGLIGALYVLLVICKLSGFYLAFGSLLSLLVLTSVQVTAYVHSLGQGSTPQARDLSL